MVRRIHFSKIETALPVQSALEACWHAFDKFGVQESVIDLELRVVRGTKPKSLTAYGKIFTIRVEDSSTGLLISLSCEELMGGDIDLSGNRGIRKKLTNYIEEELRNSSVENPEKSLTTGLIAPIASPRGGPASRSSNEPVYSRVFIYDGPSHFNHGMLVLFLGFFSISLCTPLALFAFGWGTKLLNDCRKQKSNDKSLLFDKALLMIGTALGGVGMVKFIMHLLR